MLAALPYLAPITYTSSSLDHDIKYKADMGRYYKISINIGQMQIRYKLLGCENLLP